MPPYPYRADPRLSRDEHGIQAAEWLEEMIIHEGEETVAAFIMEPIISGGGVLVPPDTYIPRIREICDRHGVLLIFDEVVSGFGRTGSMFGGDHWNCKADIYTFAKGIASGYMPLAATFVRTDIFTKFEGDDPLSHFRHINTYGGHPVAAAVGLENLRIVEEQNLVERCRVAGEYFRRQAEAVLRAHPLIGEIRGKGLLNGIELVKSAGTKEPLDSKDMTKILDHCRSRGLIVGRNGNTIPGRSNVLLVAPPFIVEDSELEMVVDTLREALDRTAGIS